MKRRDRIKLAGIVGCDPTTVDRWCRDPGAVLPTTALALEAEAKRQGFELPAPKQNDAAAGG